MSTPIPYPSNPFKVLMDVDAIEEDGDLTFTLKYYVGDVRSSWIVQAAYLNGLLENWGGVTQRIIQSTGDAGEDTKF